jgi:cysteinyl-tRNA synthetase
LGETIDLHTGGIDHIPVHHTNEIAQSEAATGKKFVNYWLHYNFLQVDGQKMSKSLENIYTVEDIKTKGFDPIALRYLFLTAHYRDKLNFTWEALEGAQNALNNLRSSLSKMIEKNENERTKLSEEKLEKIDVYNERFRNALSDDLNTPQALAVLWEMLKSNIPTPDKVDMLYSFDEIFGLGLRNVKAESLKEIPQEILDLMKYRMELRSQGRFDEADKIRAEIEKRGYSVNDTKINA